MTDIGNGCIQPVSGMLMIAPHSQRSPYFFPRISIQQKLTENIIAGYIKSFVLICVKRRSQQTQFHSFHWFIVQCQRSKRCSEQVFFLPFEIDRQIAGGLVGSERGLARLRNKLIGILREISQKSQVIFRIQLVSQVSLIIEESRSVFSFGIKRSKEISRCFVTDSVHLSKLFAGSANISRSSKQTHRSRSLKFSRFLILNIQNRRHFITVFRIKTTGREPYIPNHIGIDKTQSFLLSGTNKQRTINFNTIDINSIFIKISTTHIVLRTKFVAGTYPGKSNQVRFNSAGGIGDYTKF